MAKSTKDVYIILKKMTKDTAKALPDVLHEWDSREFDVSIMELGRKGTTTLKNEFAEPYARDGFVRISEDAYQGFDRTSKLLFRDEESYKVFIDEFHAGIDVRVYYSDDDGKFRKGVIVDILDNVVIGEHREIRVTIKLQPFKYGELITKKLPIEPYLGSFRTVIYNNGNAYCYPIYEIEAKGELLIKNHAKTLEGEWRGSEQRLQLNTIKRSDFILDFYVDNEEMEIRLLGGIGPLANSMWVHGVSGEFLCFKDGRNEFGVQLFSENIVLDKFIVYYHERWF